MTPTGIEPATYRLVAQCLNYATGYSQRNGYNSQINILQFLHFANGD